MSPRPPIWSTRDDGLSNLKDAIESNGPVDPALAVELRGHSIGTRAEARQTRGSIDGNGGPRAMTLAGYVNPLDGGEGVFVWDSTSTKADDEGVSTIQVANVTTGRWRRTQLYPTPIVYPTTGRLLGSPRVLTAGTTYTPTAGTISILVELQGAGGGSGGSTTGAAGNSSFAAGGSAGAYARKFYATIPATCTYAIGAGGTAGTSGGGGGGVGGNTTFTDGTTLVTAPGGPGGAGAGSFAAATGIAGPLGSGQATNGDLNGWGGCGGGSLQVSGTVGISGKGADSAYGGGGNGVVATSTTSGLAAGGFGAGGGGAASVNGGGSRAGGAGAPGVIVVWEFS